MEQRVELQNGSPLVGLVDGNGGDLVGLQLASEDLGIGHRFSGGSGSAGDSGTIRLVRHEVVIFAGGGAGS